MYILCNQEKETGNKKGGDYILRITILDRQCNNEQLYYLLLSETENNFVPSFIPGT